MEFATPELFVYSVPSPRVTQRARTLSQILVPSSPGFLNRNNIDIWDQKISCCRNHPCPLPSQCQWHPIPSVAMKAISRYRPLPPGGEESPWLRTTAPGLTGSLIYTRRLRNIFWVGKSMSKLMSTKANESAGEERPSHGFYTLGESNSEPYSGSQGSSWTGFTSPLLPLVPFASHLWSLPHSHTCFSFPPLSILDILQHEKLTYFKKPPPIHPVYGDLKMNRMDEGKL